jgi:hypothetical protein
MPLNEFQVPAFSSSQKTAAAVFVGSPTTDKVGCAPLRAFENELGVQDPVCFWDPLGLAADGDVQAFNRRRATEIKHGRALGSAVPAAAVAAGAFAPPAFADAIGDAAKKLGDASYPFAKSVDWNSALYQQAPGAFKPGEALKAIDKMIVMGAQADPKLLKAAVEAHHKAVGSVSGNGVTSRADWDAVNAALGRVFASVPESTVMDVYNAVSDITDSGVPAYLKAGTSGADQAYAGILDFAKVVKSNQVSSAGPSASVPSGDAISAAAKKLSDASYPFLKGIDWNSDLYIKPLPGVTAQKALKAVDKTLVMGAAMDGNALKAGAEAHHKAIGSIDGSGVTSASDYEAINNALGHMVKSVPTSKVMDVFNAWAGIISPSVPNKLFASVNPLDANAAAKAFYEFKDVVKKG